jgi:capsular exopolysaccharide synthesis family protein
MKNKALIMLSAPNSPAAEAYRALRFNLIGFTSLDSPLETVIISSPAPNETKSEVAANLAVATAQAGNRVILVDADMRRPKIHTLFDVPSEPGLSTTIANREGTMEIPLIETEVEGLAVLPCGVLPPNPADILSSSRMEHLITKLTSQADLVIFDAPPVLVAVDATALATKTDGLLLVVRSGHTRRDKLDQVKQLLSRSNTRLLGAVLTDSPERGMWTGY